MYFGIIVENWLRKKKVQRECGFAEVHWNPPNVPHNPGISPPGYVLVCLCVWLCSHQLSISDYLLILCLQPRQVHLGEGAMFTYYALVLEIQVALIASDWVKQLLSIPLNSNFTSPPNWETHIICQNWRQKYLCSISW